MLAEEDAFALARLVAGEDVVDADAVPVVLVPVTLVAVDGRMVSSPTDVSTK